MEVRRCVAAFAALAAVAGSSFAFVPWSNSFGSAPMFSWTGGGSDNGLFGSPVLAGNTFIFTPSAFRAQSDASNGYGFHFTADRLEVTITMAAGFKFDGIRISEYGDYGVFGPGSAVGVSGTLFVHDLINPAVYSDNLLTSPGTPITSGFGAWTGVADVDTSMVAPGITQVRIVLDNNLFAFANVGVGGSFIEKKFVDAGIRIDILPAPGALALVGMGGLLAARRRR